MYPRSQVTQLEEIGSKWFRVEPWKRWCARMLAKITEGGLMPDTAAASGGAAGAEEGESPAIEVRNPMMLGLARFSTQSLNM